MERKNLNVTHAWLEYISTTSSYINTLSTFYAQRNIIVSC